MNRNVYLSNTKLEKAIDIFLKKLSVKNVHKENICTWNALGRVTTSAIFAKISSPFYNSAAMDGIATSSEKTYGASEHNQIMLEAEIDYLVVDTGDPIPKEYDCVIMVEDLINISENKVKIYKGISPFQNIRLIGEDIIKNQLIIPSNHIIKPVDIGALIAGGVNEIEVYKKPVIGIVPTGTELIEPTRKIEVGKIIEFNSRVFTAQIQEWGGIPIRYDIVEDNYELIKDAINNAVEKCDIVLINAGSSAGREDFTSKIIGELGMVHVHGVAIKPGKPVILGSIKDKPVIGIPGYPVSAYFVMENICKRVLEYYNGLIHKDEKKIQAKLTRRVMSTLKYLEYIRVKVGYIDGQYITTPISRGAGVTMSLVNADGVLEIPENIEGVEAGEYVEVKLLKSEEEIKNTLICIGSHDPIIDITSLLLNQKNSKSYIASANVGSMGGIMALKNNETHIAPMHLLDMETGVYNLSYLRRYLNGKEMAIIKGVKRIQGIIVPKENPLKIMSINDIALNRGRFINRQRGSGTRLFLDYILRKNAIDSRSINGYEREEITHLGIAVAVSSGEADYGLGIFSAANLMGLDFIPLGNEEYDFVVPKELIETDIIKEFIEVIKSDEFKRRLDELGGYDYSDTGKVINLEELNE